MKILVDEMPKTSEKCVFSKIRWDADGCHIFCSLDFRSCEMDTGTDSCTYLAKGGVACELAGEDDGEKEAGETAEPDMA